MRAVQAISFGNGGDAHSLMDFGGDIIGVYHWDTSYAMNW
jgi:hypothetical protein